jgi:hypothetical protein
VAAVKYKNKKPSYKKLKMRDNHTWKAPNGYKIVVLERGAVSFNIPEGWQLTKFEPIEIYDKTPPDDNARLSVSYWRLPVGPDWSGLPIVQMLIDATKDDTQDILARGEIITSPRTDLELVWTEHRFLDPVEHREAYTRIAVARAFHVQVLITFDFWVDEAEKRIPVWSEVLGSLQLGRVIDDPTKGPTLH